MQNGFGFRGQEISQGQRPQDNRLSYKLVRLGLALFVLLSIMSWCGAPAASAAYAIQPDTPPDPALASTSNISVVKLNPPLVANGDVGLIQISPDSSRVVYTADQETDGVIELYSVPIGGGSAVKLNPPLVANGDVGLIQISPDSSRVVYVADQETNGVPELYSVPIGGGSAVKLNAPLVANGGVGVILISPDSNRVVYWADQETDGIFELYSVPIGGGSAVKLNAPLVANGHVWNYQISQNSSRVVYQADQETDGVEELYSVPIGGGSAVKLNAPLVANGHVWINQISQNSSRVVYVADQETNGVPELYSVPIGGGSAVKLNAPLVANGGVGNYWISSDSNRVVYWADQETDEVVELYSVPIGGGSAVKLNAPLGDNGDVVNYFQISPDSNRVVYWADQETDGVFELYSVPIGGGSAVKLNAPLGDNGLSDYSQISLDSSQVVHRVKGTNQVFELYSVPIGGGSAVKLNAPLVANGDVLDSQISPNSGQVVYQADQETNGVPESYSVPIGGGSAVKLNAPLVANGGVGGLWISPDSNRVVYLADQETDGVVELYSTLLWTSDLRIDKTVNAAVAKPGDVVAYTVAVSAQNGFAPIAVTDTLPSGVSFEGVSSPDVTYEPRQHQLRYNGTLEPNQPLSFTYTARIKADVAPGSILQSQALVTAFADTYVAGASVAVPQQVVIPTLNLLVLGGDNNLGPEMIDLFQKAEAAAGNPTMTTLLLIDGPENGDAYLYRLQPDQNQSEFCPTAQNPTCNGRYTENVTMWRWGEAIATSSSLIEFLTKAISAYPARQITLSLVGHGGGWSPDLLPGQPSFHDVKPGQDELGGLLWDNNPSSSLSTRELGQALREVTTTTGRRIDLLYLDACLMAMSEVAYELRDSVDYLLASENVSWTSFRYDQHLALDGGLTPLELGKQWIQHEADELRGDGTRPNYPFTYSLLDLRVMDELLVVESTLADTLTAELPLFRTQIRNAFLQSACFDGDQDFMLLPADIDDYYCDLASFAQQLQDLLPVGDPIVGKALELETLITSRLRKDEAHNPGRPWPSPENEWQWKELGGVSIYMPLGEDDWKRAYYTPTYLQSTDKGTWDEFLAAYWNSAPPPAPPATCNEVCNPKGPEPLKDYKTYLPVVTK